MALVILCFILSIFSSLRCDNGELTTQNNEECPRGTYCKGAEHNRPVCPAGFFCPEGSPAPVPCPPGTFRPEGAALVSQNCLMCPVDFFNPMPGQKSCLPCGSEAEQPAEGQETCICLGKGQMFQPRDARCVCRPGYQQSSGDGRHCVRVTYDICRDSASRNQEGQCLTKKEWARYCSEKVCTAPSDYQGYDKVLGLCICQTESLESVCSSRCRRQQRNTLQITCAGTDTQLLITSRDGSKTAASLEELTTALLPSHFSVQDTCTSEPSEHTHPTYIVEMSGKGFLGVYNPDPQLLHKLIMLKEASSRHNNGSSSEASPVPSNHQEHSSAEEQSLSPSNFTPNITFTGILNPTTCIDVNVTLLFIVSREHYPVYDVNHLYNSNPDFDWGDLRSLREEVAEASRQFLLFLLQPRQPGTFVLRLSSDRHKRMYLRVMPVGGRCYEEGPFFPTTPRFAVQVGITRSRELPLKPDWAAITGVITGLLLLLLASVVLTLLCQGLVWSQKGTACPAFRRQQLKYNLDSYSSAASTVLPVRKHHPSLQNEGRRDGGSCGAGGTALFLKRSDAWEPEEQVDLEGFNTNVFFELLLQQSLSVTTQLGHLKEEVKTLHRKLTSETSSLKNLWAKTLSDPEVMEAREGTGTEDSLAAKQQAEEEIQKRKQLAADYEDSVTKQMQSLQQDLRCQQEHCIAFNSALREALRWAELLADKVARKGNQTTLPQTGRTSPLAWLEAASSKMSRLLTEESQRLTAWGVLGEGTGAWLLDAAKTQTLTKQELLDSDGTIRAPDAVHVDPVTGLLTPHPDGTFLLAGQCPGPVPSNHFLHPETGKVLHVAGNVGYDPIRSRLVCAVDSASGEHHKPEGPIFPYIPYPVCPSTDLPVKTKLPVLCPEKTFGVGGLMLDPVTGIEVPVLGVTIHPHTRQALTVGGTYLNPLTGTVTPLEIGGPMIEPEGGKVVPILGVALDSNTGEVVPLGGLLDPSRSVRLLGDSFTESLSVKMARVHGAHLQQDKVLPHGGSYQAVLESAWLVAQSRVLSTLKQFKESVLEDTGLAADRLAALKASVEDMKMSFTTKLYYALHCLHSLEKKREIALSLKRTGGKLGDIKYPGTGMWIPAVFGMEIPDPGGSSLMVPILGMDWDWKTGQPFPLAGTMEDRDGKGLVPISIGARTISLSTGEPGPVIGAQTHPWTHNVVPTVQSLGALPRRAADPELLDFLERELNSRHLHWHCRREKEEELLAELTALFLHVLEATEEGKARQITCKDKVKSIEEKCLFLKSSSLRKAERRTSKCFSSQLATELSWLFKGDRDETEQEMKVLLEARKMLEQLLQFLGKMQQEEERLHVQLTEREKQRSHSSSVETGMKLALRKVMLALSSESQAQIRNQQETVEATCARLEYLRDLADTRMQQAKVLFSGSQQCFENYETTRFYGTRGVSHSTRTVIQQNLIPLLKSTVQMLEEKSTSSSAPETSGCSQRSTSKASAACSEASKAEADQEAASASKASPVLPIPQSERISHMQREIQTRFLFEKHAGERAHLELSLLMAETHALFSFHASPQGKELPKGNRGLKTSRETEAAKQSLLGELSEHHQHMEQALIQKQLEEIKGSGLSPAISVPKHIPPFLEEIPQQLSVCSPGSQDPDPSGAEQQDTRSWEAGHSPDLLAQTLRASAVKIVKLEALRQMCLYRVLDLYSNLQVLSWPEGVRRILTRFSYTSRGEEAVREVARAGEEQQVARVVAFLQEHHQEGDLLKGLKEESEAELRNMQAQFRWELQRQAEEKIQAKETQVMEETRGDKLWGLVVYSILSQRHLRQTVLMLQDCSRLKKIAMRCQKEGLSLQHLLAEELSADEDTRGISHLLKNTTEHLVLVLEFIQTARLLQLREAQFEEVVGNLEGCTLEKLVTRAHVVANGLKKYRAQKMKRLEEQLKLFLEKKRMDHSSHLDPQQKSMRGCSEAKAFLRRDSHPDVLFPSLCTNNERKEETQQTSSPLSSTIESFWVPGMHHNRDDQLLLFLTKSIKVLKQAEHLMASRIVLLNPQFTAPSPCDGDETSCTQPSVLLGLLKDVNNDLRQHAEAAGLLQRQRLDKKTANPPQDAEDALMAQGEPTALDPLTLSTREFVTYQYGISILRFLRVHIDAPEINLCVTSNIPLSNATGSAFRNCFFYQSSENKLFVLRDCLGSVGGFLLLLTHCFAHIAAADFSHDTSPLFLRLFYQALKACLSEMFSLRLQLSAALQDDRSCRISQMLLKEEPFSKEEINLISQLFEVKVKSLTETLEKVTEATVPGLIDSSSSPSSHLARRQQFKM